MKPLSREWPPDVEQKPKKPAPPEVNVALGLFFLSPLVMWLIMAWPGDYAWWVPLIWPGGWSVVVLIAVTGSAVREREKQ